MDGQYPAGWEWTCHPLLAVSNVPPDGGDWSAVLKVDRTDTCSQFHAFQRLQGVQDGEVLRLSGWLRAVDGAPVVGAYMALGTLNDGVFTLQAEIGTTSFEWTASEVTNTMQLGPGDTAVVVLHPGELPNGGIFSFAGFDELVLTVPQSIAEDLATRLLVRHDPSNRVIDVAIPGGGHIHELMLIDPLGRMVARQGGPPLQQRSLPLPHVTTGTYLLMAVHAGGRSAVRVLLQ